MKRILLIAICAMLVISLAACAARNTEQAEEPEGGESVGGWTINTNNVASLSKEDEDLFTMATASSDVLYEPIAKVATQVVAGTNHAFLCTANVDGGKWYFVTVYQPLDGDPEMIGTSEFDVINYASIGEADGEAVGAWEVTEGGIYSLPSDAFSAYEKASEGLVGVGYTPIALLATQLVSGTNYRFLCSGTTVTAEPVTSLYVMEVYEDLDGKAKITTVDMLDLNEYVGAK